MLDTSGSMTGLRKEIAKHTVLTILETLSEDDFVAIYKFATYPEVWVSKLLGPISKFCSGNPRADIEANKIHNIEKTTLFGD